MAGSTGIATADLYDAHGDALQVLAPNALHDFGGVRAAAGAVATIRCHEDNGRVREAVAESG